MAGENFTRKFRIVVILFLGFLCLQFSSCAVNPVTGKKEIIFFSEESEIKLGQQTDQEIRAQFGVYEDSRLTNYLQRVGQALVPHTHRPHLNYQFTILNVPLINAFAVPGGYIYVTRGLLAALNSEAELALVLGHELGHINARHSVKKLSQVMIVQIGLAVAGALSETMAKISGLAGIGLQLLFLKYSRDDERQADELGILYARQSGYNPEKMISFFTTLEKLGDLSGGHQLPGFLSTHPLTSERIQRAKSLLHPEDSKLKIGYSSYLQQLDKLIFGEDPRYGFVEGNTFYHPHFRLQISFPAQWKIVKQPKQVSFTAPDQQAGFIIQGEESTANLEAYAQQKAAQLEQGIVISQGTENLNGVISFQQTIKLTTSENSTIILRQNFVRQDRFIFTLSAVAEEDKYPGYQDAFQFITFSFRRLTDSRYLNRQPRRLVLIKANGHSSLRQIFQKANTPQELWEKLAIMNAITLDEKPPRGRLIKLVK